MELRWRGFWLATTWWLATAEGFETGLNWRAERIRTSCAASTIEKAAAVDTVDEDPHLESLRRSIDNFDAAIIHLLAERFKTTQAVGEYKARAGLPPSDSSREDRQVTRLRQLAQDAGLDPEFSEKFLRFVVDEVINHHKRIAKEEVLNGEST